MKPRLPLFENEKLLYEIRPKPVLVTYLFLSSCIAYLIILYLFIVVLKNAYFLNEFVFIFLLILFITYQWYRMAVPTYWYFFTNQRCIIYYRKKEKIVAYENISRIKISQGPLEKLLNIASIRIVEPTLGTYRTFPAINERSILIVGLDYHKAKLLVKLIKELRNKMLFNEYE